MTIRRQRRAAVAVLVAAVALGHGVASAADDPAELGKPLAEQMAESIHVWDLSAA